jgi:hypothetical protein
MADDTASGNLHHVLEHGSELVHKPKSTVLFRRGEKASGMFVVLGGKVRLDLGSTRLSVVLVVKAPWLACRLP